MQMNNQIRLFKPIITGLLIVLLCVWSIRILLSYNKVAWAKNQQDTTKLMGALRVGMTLNQANAAIIANGGFRSHINGTGSEMWAKSPLILGSINWNVRLFLKKGRVVQICVRDEDNPAGPRPDNAPPDKLA